MKLYEITEAYLALDELEPTEDIKTYLGAIADEFDTKAENLAGYIQSIDGDVENYKREEKRLADKRRSLEKKREYLKEYLFENMQRTNRKAIKAGTFDLKIQKNPKSVKIVSPELIEGNYYRLKSEIDKAKIKEDLLQGIEVIGAELEQKESLRIK